MELPQGLSSFTCNISQGSPDLGANIQGQVNGTDGSKRKQKVHSLLDLGVSRI